MLTLYHGTNIFFRDIDLTMSNPFKDFGKGFYLTPDPEQAMIMANRRKRITKQGNTVVLKYLFDESNLTNGELNVLQFHNPSKEWAQFILKNRYKDKFEPHPYDIVIGPIADDGVAFQLERYVQNIITLDKLVEELTFKHLYTQYYFGTQKALSFLRQQYD